MEMKYGSLKNVEHFQGNVENFYTAKLIYMNKSLNITYDCNKNNIIIHEWYSLNKDELTQITDELLKYFLNINSIN